MIRTHLAIIALAIGALSLTLSAPLFAASMGTSGGHDLDRLWRNAQVQYDFAAHDAVVLLESRHVSLLADGNMRTAVHRVVWIGTARGIRDYADLRIPNNSATSSMTVTALRTWRGGRWWPDASEISPTAVVETLPYAVALADDYTTMRETMLLHDGIELPCIMETAYTIEESGSSRGGFDGVYMFPQNDPALVSVFQLTLPAGAAVSHETAHGAPDPAITKGADGTLTYTWMMELVEPLGVPHIASQLSYVPHIAWSTWSDWQALGDAFMAAFDRAAPVSGALADSLAVRLEHEPSPMAKARKVSSLVDEWTRAVRCDARFWMFAPRTAERVYETAYGHDLDRAALAAGLFRLAGLEAEPIFYSSGVLYFPGAAGGSIEIPTLSYFENIGVEVHDQDLSALYDPRAGALIESNYRASVAHISWLPASNEIPAREIPGMKCRYELILTLEPDGETGWRGTGYLRASLALSPYGEMVGLENQMKERLGTIAKSVLPGSVVNHCNPEFFHHSTVAAGFDLQIDKIEPDKLGRTVITIGDPAGGIHSRLPEDIHPYQERRTSPTVLPHTLSQKVTLRLKTGDRTVVSQPLAGGIENETGSFAIEVSQADGWITVERSLTLQGGLWGPDRWTELRSLLLEEKDAGGRTIVLE